ncbi:MAG: YihY/virulence factor BrkB family protein [Steroidobacteraceae bacterium]
MLDVFANRLTQWLFDPPEHLLGKTLHPALRLLRYPYALIRDLMHGQLNLRAMSLVYSTLLSLAPLLALAFSVLKGLGYNRDLEVVLYSFLEPIGSKATELTARIMSFVNSVRGDVLGPISVAVLIYNVISAVQKVEESFNFVWQVEKPRSWARRFSEYLSVMVIGPVFVAAVVAVLQSNVVLKFSQLTGIAWTLEHIKHLASFLLLSIALTFLYYFIPNTKVRVGAALIGGLVAGALWTIGGILFTLFAATSTQYALIYAGFAIVIVALFWLYMSWLILLLGAQLSFYIQNPQSLRSGSREVHLTAALYERLGLSVMYLIARDYQQGVPHWTLNALSEHFDVPARSLKPVMDTLENHELLTGTDNERYVPGRDPQAIPLSEIFDALRNDTRNPRIPRVRGAAAAEAIAQTATEAMNQSVQGQTLASLVAQHP